MYIAGVTSRLGGFFARCQASGRGKIRGVREIMEEGQKDTYGEKIWLACRY